MITKFSTDLLSYSVRYRNLSAGTSTFFIATLSDANSNFANSVTFDSNGNLYAGGNTTDSAIVYESVIATDTTGALRWQQRVASNPTAQPFKNTCASRDANGVYFGSMTYNSSVGVMNVLNLNAAGSVITQRQIASGYYVQDTPQGLDVDSSGNVHAAFVGQSQSNNSYDMQLVKYSSAGTIAWQKTGQASAYIHYCNGVRVDASGNVYVSGHYRYNGAGVVFRANLTKFDSAGTVLWKRMLTHTGHVYAAGTAFDSAGGAYLLCQSNVSGDGADMTLVKYDSAGTLQWQRQLTGSSTSDTPYAIYVDASDFIYITGISNAGGSNKVQIAKYNTSGTIQWQRRLSTTVATEGHAIQVNGSVMYISGLTASAANDILIAKLPSDGSGLGTYTVGSNAYTYEASTLTDSAGGLTSGTDLVAWNNPVTAWGVSTYSSTPTTTSLTYAKAAV